MVGALFFKFFKSPRMGNIASLDYSNVNPLLGNYPSISECFLWGLTVCHAAGKLANGCDICAVLLAPNNKYGVFGFHVSSILY